MAIIIDQKLRNGHVDKLIFYHILSTLVEGKL